MCVRACGRRVSVVDIRASVRMLVVSASWGQYHLLFVYVFGLFIRTLAMGSFIHDVLQTDARGAWCVCRLRLRLERPCGGRCPLARECAEGAAAAGVRGGSNLGRNSEEQFLYPCQPLLVLRYCCNI
jgi:hypothetical protein